MCEFRLATYAYPGFEAGPWAPARGIRYRLCKMFVRYENRRGPGTAWIEYRTVPNKRGQ